MRRLNTLLPVKYLHRYGFYRKLQDSILVSLQVENQTAIYFAIRKSQARKCKIVIPASDSKHALQNTITVS